MRLIFVLLAWLCGAGFAQAVELPEGYDLTVNEGWVTIAYKGKMYFTTKYGSETGRLVLVDGPRDINGDGILDIRVVYDDGAGFKQYSILTFKPEGLEYLYERYMTNEEMEILGMNDPSDEILNLIIRNADANGYRPVFHNP
nr:hypothetical protein [uncultured Cohaesibacter sp.]